MSENKNRVYIFDTTMRDGEQSPGASMSLEEKLQISNLFDQIGVDIIEAGFPAASRGDFESVSEVSKILKTSIPCGLARHIKKILMCVMKRLNQLSDLEFIHLFQLVHYI